MMLNAGRLHVTKPVKHQVRTVHMDDVQYINVASALNTGALDEGTFPICNPRNANRRNPLGINLQQYSTRSSWFCIGFDPCPCTCKMYACMNSE